MHPAGNRCMHRFRVRRMRRTPTTICHMVGVIIVVAIIVVCLAGFAVLRNPSQDLRDGLRRIGPMGDPGPVGDEEFEPPKDY